jgi:hypothetical protein
MGCVSLSGIRRSYYQERFVPRLPPQCTSLTSPAVSYGIGLIGLIVSGCLYLFVRILRNSPHLQKDTLVHWGTWLGCTIGLGSIAFLLAEAVPIFNYLIALTGSLCFAPLAIALPGFLWLHDHGHYRRGSLVQKIIWGMHAFLPFLGAFLCVGGTYGVVQSIIAAYADGEIGELSFLLPLVCLDNDANG